ncbi:MAG: hypothetical protein ACJ71P_20995, partial [Nitrososphaeraceae archaeon]
MNAAGGSAISDEIKKSVGKTIENCSGARCTDTPHDDSGGSGSGGGGSHHSSKHHHKGNAGFDTGSVSRTLGGDSSNAIETGTAPTPTTTDDNGVLN